MDIHDLCQKRRHEMRATYQYIADESGVPLCSVTNFLSGRYKSPSINTVGPICAVLGISIDEYFGICPNSREVDELKQLSQGKEIETIVKNVLENIFHNL